MIGHHQLLSDNANQQPTLQDAHQPSALITGSKTAWQHGMQPGSTSIIAPKLILILAQPLPVHGKDRAVKMAAIDTDPARSGPSSHTGSIDLSLSIVSHGQGAMIRALLDDLSRLDLEGVEIIVTLNITEDESFLTAHKLPNLIVIRNAERKGFGANHNGAFAQSHGELFCILNPDIRINNKTLETLKVVFKADETVGSCAPLIVGPDKKVQDSARRFPTFARLLRRALGNRAPDYAPQTRMPVDWTAGMLVMFRRTAFQHIGGFDERYFMYMEDADICRRLSRAGCQVLLEPRATAIHDAQRASHRNLRHLSWHVRSVFRFLYGI